MCAFDCETSGLIIGQARIVEVACVLFDTKIKKATEFWSSWVWAPDYPPMLKSDEAFRINGLDPEELKLHGKHPEKVFQRVVSTFDLCDAILAHNGLSFDKPLFDFESLRYGFMKRNTPVIDSRTDLPYPPGMTSKRLNHLAVDHGIHNPFAHRALFDVWTMLEIAKNYDLELALERSKSPLIRIEVRCERSENQVVKNNRYLWDPTKKCWHKMIREIDLEKEQSNVPFKIERVENGKKET